MNRILGLVAAVATVLALGTGPVAAAPATVTSGPRTVTVSEVDGLDPAGATVRVTGSGFDTSKGIYVALCVVPPAGQPPSPCGGGIDMSGESEASAWISSNPPPYGEGLAQPYGPGGSFDVQLHVQAVLADGYDCRQIACAVTTRNDHTRSGDRSQDVFVPVSFGPAAPPPPPAGGPAPPEMPELPAPAPAPPAPAPAPAPAPPPPPPAPGPAPAPPRPSPSPSPSASPRPSPSPSPSPTTPDEPTIPSTRPTRPSRDDATDDATPLAGLIGPSDGPTASDHPEDGRAVVGRDPRPTPTQESTIRQSVTVATTADRGPLLATGSVSFAVAAGLLLVATRQRARANRKGLT